MVNVTKISDETATDIDASGLLRENAFMSLSYVSVTLTTLYESLYASAFHTNVGNVAYQRGHVNATSDDVLSGIEDSIEAILDAYLINFSAAQILIANETSATAARVGYKAASLGQPGYVYATFAINVVLLLIVLIETAITRFWRRAPLLNIFDVKSSILAATTIQSSDLSKAAIAWSGDSADRKLGSVRLRSNGAGHLQHDESTMSTETFLLAERI